ncbi:MAG: glycosyltransferase family 4 protein [Chloroflexota bacterium]
MTAKPKLLYIANIRMPTEKAHGLQIAQNCEAFADAGAEVELWVARRVNTPELGEITDIWAHYGVKRNFTLRRIPCIDLLPLVPDRNDLLARLIFYFQQGTFVLMALLRALFTRADIFYSRDAINILALSFIKPGHKLAYEAHRRASGQGGRWLQSRVISRAGTVIAVTARLKADLEALSPSQNMGSQEKFMVAHDGIRAERFANMPSQAEARAAVGWPLDAFIVGYVGRLQTMAMDKGVGTLVEALQNVKGATLALVGGPENSAEEFHQYWLKLGMDDTHFLNAGQVSPEHVPIYLSALDVCAMPFPWTEHFAYYASPMKLFEYMASGRVIVATDLPSTVEVVHDGESALLVPPSDATALGAAIARLRDDLALREQLATRAYDEVLGHYTWASRAAAILEKIQNAQLKVKS